MTAVDLYLACGVCAALSLVAVLEIRVRHGGEMPAEADDMTPADIFNGVFAALLMVASWCFAAVATWMLCT